MPFVQLLEFRVGSVGFLHSLGSGMGALRAHKASIQ